MSALQLALFDLDGTLIDSEVGIVSSIEHALRTLGAAMPSREALRGWIGPPLRATFPLALGDDAATIERAVELYRERFSSVGWQEHVVYAGIGDVVESLARERMQLAVVTTKVDLYAEKIVRSLPFGSCFTRVYAASAGSAHSEKATMIAQALVDFGIAPENAAMVGDRHFDIEGAKANRVRAIGVTWGFGSREELRDARADLIVDTPADLGDSIARVTFVE